MSAAGQDRNENIKLAEYVVGNIDTAINNGWLRVYYQPVIRTLTGQLCGAESLARWDDPVHGFLNPDKFISALESSRQIHKLDCWIIDSVCKDISTRLSNHLDTVPVSVNFSILDFEVTDMLEYLENAIVKYDIPKDYIHVEITESMIASDSKLMAAVINNMRNAGFEVWMDDFGSGYSSLNLLKDYRFDTIKLDMEFLSSLTDISKAIVTSAITMAKDIGIMTLAEGVETPEQVAFLESIGCGKLQGYFYGAPMPIDKFFEHINARGITIEPRQWRNYYQIASFCARYTEEPLEIIEDDGENFRTLFMNDAYKRQIFNSNFSIEDMDKRIYHINSPLIKQYREFADIIENTKNSETFYYTNNGNVLCFQGEEIAEHGGKHLIKGAIRNISADVYLKAQVSVDNKLKELNHLFETVMLINPDKNTIYPLLGSQQYIDDMGDNIKILNKNMEMLANKYIAAADRAKFYEFLDFSSVRERIDESGKGYIENIFRIKQADGNYKWKEMSVMLIPGTDGKEFLVCTKATTDDAQNFLSSNNEIFTPDDYGFSSEDTEQYSKMWKTVVTSSPIKFFWKDRNRIYRGVSKAFLDFFDIQINDILDKTDDDIGLLVDGDSFRNDELAVIEKGAVIDHSSGQCIENGIAHNIMSFKSPIYDNGQIVGLMGYFFDVDEELEYLDKSYNERRLDPVTGLMNVSAHAEVARTYAHNYAANKVNFTLIILRNEKHHRIVEDYGEEFGNELLRKMAEVLLDITKGSCAIAKCVGADFALLTDVVDRKPLEALIENIKTSLEKIQKIDGNSVTVKIRIGYKRRTDEGITDENMYSAVLQELM